MKSTLIFLIVALAPYATVSAQQQRVSRFAVVEIKDDEDRLKHWLLLNGKEIYQCEGESIQVVKALNGTDRDYLLIGAYSGDNSLP